MAPKRSYSEETILFDRTCICVVKNARHFWISVRCLSTRKTTTIEELADDKIMFDGADTAELEYFFFFFEPDTMPELSDEKRAPTLIPFSRRKALRYEFEASTTNELLLDEGNSHKEIKKKLNTEFESLKSLQKAIEVVF